jgi:hypothetical protein
LSFSHYNTSFEIVKGVDRYGFTFSQDVNFNGEYLHNYVRTIPIALGVLGVYYCGAGILIPIFMGEAMS